MQKRRISQPIRLHVFQTQQEVAVKKKMSKLTLARMIASGALLGIVIAGMFGVDLTLNSSASLISGAAGAAGSAMLLKLVHLI